MRYSAPVAAIVTTTIVLVAGCSSSSSSSGASHGALTVTEKEFSLSLSSSEVDAGRVTVTVKNEGAVPHELVVFRTDLDETSLPLLADGHRIDEEASGITHLDPEAEDVGSADSKTITIDLPPGRYVFVCNLADHYTSGMHAVVTSS
jgi:uncharacterized cupredoxin-like copper-binding protein